MANRFFITGTDTGVGKTVVSATLCAALDALYWKPVQTGTREGTDRATVMRIAGLPRGRTIPEVYRFAPPVSPHLAARRAGARIELDKIVAPKIAAEETLIAEGAGGVLVPLNETQLMTALMARLRLPVLLVTRTSLGTINHSLLSITALRHARVELRGVIMVGKANAENRKAIEHYGAVPVIGWLPPLAKLNRAALLRAFRRHFDRSAFGR
jgi:dethiobiotin synthase